MNTKVGNDILEVVNLLSSGELVAIPTETVYGLAAIFSNENAIKKIFEVKKRPASNPLILHVDSIEQIHLYVEEFPKIFQELATIFCPGPLTFLMNKSDIVSELITAGKNRVAVRIPDNIDTIRIIKALGFPVVAPSANLYGKLSPTRAHHVVDQLDGMISYVFDGGECERGIESTIIGLEGNEVVIYRLGSISPEDLGQHLGYLPGLKVHEDKIPVASGMVKYHYAPSTPCSFYNSNQTYEENVGFIFISKKLEEMPDRNVRLLTESGDLNEAARKLYATLHEMDRLEFSHIYIESAPDKGIGKAINDRLSRAVAKFKADKNNC